MLRLEIKIEDLKVTDTHYSFTYIVYSEGVEIKRDRVLHSHYFGEEVDKCEKFLKSGEVYEIALENVEVRDILKRRNK